MMMIFGGEEMFGVPHVIFELEMILLRAMMSHWW